MLIMFRSNISSKQAANKHVVTTRNCGTYGIDKRTVHQPLFAPPPVHASADLQKTEDGAELRKIQLVLCLRIA